MQHTPVAGKTWKGTSKLVALFVSLLVCSFFVLRGNKPVESEKQEVKAPVTATAPVVREMPVQMIQNNTEVSESKVDEESSRLEKMRTVAPIQVYSADEQPAQVGGVDPSHGKSGLISNDTNGQFLNQLANSKTPTEQATDIEHPSTTLSQGTMIWATMESRIVSDLPGMVRAITAEDIFYEDGTKILVPKGSRLIGQYTNAVSQGQRRVFVVWQRLIRPDHIDIQITSQGTDPLGAAGMGADGIDRHFVEQFGSSILLSIIGAGAATMNVNSSDQFNSASAYREALSNSFSQSAQQTLKQKGEIGPTITINQGHKISVFVTRDLDFYDALKDKGIL